MLICWLVLAWMVLMAFALLLAGMLVYVRRLKGIGWAAAVVLGGLMSAFLIEPDRPGVETGGHPWKGEHPRRLDRLDQLPGCACTSRKPSLRAG